MPTSDGTVAPGQPSSWQGGGPGGEEAAPTMQVDDYGNHTKIIGHTLQAFTRPSGFHGRPTCGTASDLIVTYRSVKSGLSAICSEIIADDNAFLNYTILFMPSEVGML